MVSKLITTIEWELQASRYITQTVLTVGLESVLSLASFALSPNSTPDEQMRLLCDTNRDKRPHHIHHTIPAIPPEFLQVLEYLESLNSTKIIQGSILEDTTLICIITSASVCHSVCLSVGLLLYKTFTSVLGQGNNRVFFWGGGGGWGSVLLSGLHDWSQSTDLIYLYGSYYDVIVSQLLCTNNYY